MASSVARQECYRHVQQLTHGYEVAGLAIRRVDVNDGGFIKPLDLIETAAADDCYFCLGVIGH